MTYKTEKKPKTQLVDPCFIEGMALVQEIGDEKHRDHHWLQGVPVSEIIGAIERHVNAIKLGEVIDDETGHQHAYHAACGLMYIAHYSRNHEEYAEFFDLVYSRHAEVGGGMGRLPISESDGARVPHQTSGGNSRTVRESIRRRTSGCIPTSAGSVSPDGGEAGTGVSQQAEGE